MAYLTVLTGPMAGRKILLDTDCFSIGRLAANNLELPDVSVSREHCVIEAQGGRPIVSFLIRDLSSSNGVIVNDRIVTEYELRHADRIQIGDWVLRFDEDESRVTLSDCDNAMESTFQLASAEVRSMQSGKTPVTMPETERYSDDLRALLDISIALSGLRSVAEIQACFLKGIAPRIPADYAAAIPMVSGNLEQSVRRAAEVRLNQRTDTEPSPGFAVSRTVLEHVLQTQEAILAGPPREDRILAKAESIVRSGTQAVIAVPAFSENGLIAVLYLAATAEGAFDVYHLRLAAATAGILGAAIKRALASEELERENERLLSKVRIRHQIVGASPEIAKVLVDVQRISPSDTTVLILGETGTGKELVAQAIHANSPRASRPLVAFNCAAFNESLIESELFGHERGAFSGASTLKRGLFEQAHGGTLFLDEIGELNPQLQAKLLRVLESREIRRLGSEKAIPVDFRLITATHRDLREAVKTGAFRSDLYYRLDVMPINIPPLRERRRDILPLAEHFLAQFRGKTSRQIEGFAGPSQDYLLRYDWPGNVRELRNAVERAVIAGASSSIEIEDLPDSLAGAGAGPSESIPYRQSLLEARRKIIVEAFQTADGKHARAAQLLGVHPNNLHRMLNELGLRDQVRRALG